MSKENEKTLEATVGMAIMDALPVLLFGASMLLISQVYSSALFTTGAILCVLAGFGKVLWKLILAAVHKDIKLLCRQFGYLMPAGFLLMILSLILNRPSIAVLWKNVSSFPCNILFLLALVGMVVMGILAAITQKEQWDQTVETILEWMGAH